ncbi:MAG: class I SAM-dependent methyltransferase [Tannerella sp.]|jgi:hypothetical protein|nr:class I SAM-dependent methyltransferase [Tannerella sp.]
MQCNEVFKKFVVEHAGDDVNTLILNASRYKDVDVKPAAEQIAARRVIREKLPEWHDNPDLFFPSVTAAEQCSSELTAHYKQRFVNEEDTVYDLTGGLGVDTYYFAQKAKQVVYIERNKKYCEAASHNFQILQANNIKVINADSQIFINHPYPSHEGKFNYTLNTKNYTLYLDPSRRNAANKRLYALEDCEPDLSKIWSDLRKIADKIIVKLSPMLDISHIVEKLPGISEIHIVSVRNDCKEVIAIAENRENISVKIFCINYLSDKSEQTFTYFWNEEKTAEIRCTSEIKKYLYEPNASILKAGAYKSVARQLNLEKLHPGSHLYTSDEAMRDFPGRIFQVIEMYPFHNQACKELTAAVAKANITVRNFPLSAEALKKRLKIRDGGDIYLFATTLQDIRKVLIRCVKA